MTFPSTTRLRDRAMATRRALLPGTLLVAAMLSGCDTGSSDPELRQAARAMQQMSSRSTLTRSCFYVAYPGGSAADFLDYLFSPLGTAEWPPRDSKTAPGEDISPEQAAIHEAMAFEAEQARAAGLPVLPGSVRINRLERKNTTARELVLTADGEQGKVLAKGYLPGEEEPVLEKAWTLAKASPDQATRQLCQSNIEMGVRVRP